MTIRVGIYVGADWLTGVAVARHAIVWRARVEYTSDTSLEAQLAVLLQGIPVRRYMRLPVFVALGPALAQVKLLRGLPPIATPRVLRQLVEATPSRFFLVGEGTLVVAEPKGCAEGWWVAVADAATIATIDTQCSRRGLRVRGMRPVATLLGHALANAASGTRIKWIDGRVSLDVTCGEHGIARIQRESTQHGESDSATTGLHGPLADVGAEAWRYAGAYAAVRAGNAAPLLLPRPDIGHRRQHRAVRRIASIAALAVGAVVTLAAPGVVAARARNQNERAFGALRATVSAVTKDRVALDQQQSALRQVRAFAATRRLITPLLSTLSLQLPESTAIVSLRLDTLGGSLVALSPVGAELVSAVNATPGVDGLQLSAPITREAIGPLELQRTALRFRFKRSAPMTRVQHR